MPAVWPAVAAIASSSRPAHSSVTEVPILSVNARNDYVAPEFDMELANNSTVDGTLIVSARLKPPA